MPHQRRLRRHALLLAAGHGSVRDVPDAGEDVRVRRGWDSRGCLYRDAASVPWMPGWQLDAVHPEVLRRLVRGRGHVQRDYRPLRSRSMRGGVRMPREHEVHGNGRRGRPRLRRPVVLDGRGLRLRGLLERYLHPGPGIVQRSGGMMRAAALAALFLVSCGGNGGDADNDGDAHDAADASDLSDASDTTEEDQGDPAVDPVEMDETIDADAGDADGADPEAGDPLVISDVAVETNPLSTISFWVRWTTNRPATSRVEHGEDASYGWSRGSADLATVHRVLVAGCPELTDIHFRALSTDAGGELAVSPDTVHATGALPDLIPDVALEVMATPAARPGVTLMNISHISDGAPDVVVYLDMLGRVIWYWVGGGSDDGGGVNTQQLEGGIVLVSGAGNRPWSHVDLSGEVVLEGVQPPAGEGNVHHDTIQLSDGSTALIRGWTIPHPLDASSDLNYDSIEILDTPTGASIWSWSVLDHLPVPPATTRAWTHGNAVLVEPAEGFAWFNLKKIDRLLKIDMSTGDILWQFGDPALCLECDFALVGGGSWPSKPHSPDFLPDGHLIIYDNGLTGVAPQTSRAVEYEVDEVAMTVTQVWEFAGPPEWFTPSWGDADRLDNGNTLITAGNFTVGSISQVFEATSAGEVVWAISLPETYGVYRAERLDSIER